MIDMTTGGTGFIGKTLVDKLVERGDQVRLISRNSLNANKMAET